MTTFVALLRAVNLGRARKLAMSDLRALLESLGLADVRTHLQSGNAIFNVRSGSGRDLERRIESQIGTRLGMDVAVFVRSLAELAGIVDGNPFAKAGVDPKQLHVSFLSSQPAAKKVAGVDGSAYRPDEFAFGRRVLYVRLPNGVAGARLPDWERLLGVRATMRTWNTVTRLQGLASA